MPKDQISPSREFTFTDHNTSVENEESLLAHPLFSYILIGREICPTTDKPHLQCYAQLKTKQRFSALKKVSPTAHWEPSQGSDEENYKYCTKDRTFKERGLRRVSVGLARARNDLSSVRRQVFEGVSLSKIAEESTSYQSLRYAESLVKYVPMRQRNPPEVHWCWGPTGTGKTRWCFDQCPDLADTWVSNSDNGLWFDGYYGQRSVIIDDFRFDWCPFAKFLKLIDRYPLRVAVKGGFVNWNPEKIYITSPFKPADAFSNRGIEDIAQVERRITKVHHFASI